MNFSRFDSPDSLKAEALPQPHVNAHASSSPESPSAMLARGHQCRTTGEVIHNEITYRGIDWILNAAMGVGFTYLAGRTKAGEALFSTPVTNFFRKTLKPFIADPQKLEEGAAWGRAFASITFGGFTTIPMLMAIESPDNKKAIIKGIDRWVYGDDAVKKEPYFEARYGLIYQEPVKDFNAGMLARFGSLAPLLAATVMYPKQMDQYMYQPISKLSKWAARTTNIQPAALMERKLADESGKLVSDWDYIHQKIGFDFGLTMIYAFLHEYTYKAASMLLNGPNAAPAPAKPQKPDSYVNRSSLELEGTTQQTGFDEQRSAG